MIERRAAVGLHIQKCEEGGIYIYTFRLLGSLSSM